MPKIILEATTQAGATESVSIRNAGKIPVSISANGLLDGEYVTLQYSDGTDWHDYYANGAEFPERITNRNCWLSIYAPGVWRGNKSVTASPVAVYFHTHSNA